MSNDKKVEKKSNDLLIGVIVAVVVLALIVGLAWYLSANKDDAQVESAQDQVSEEDVDLDQLINDLNSSEITLYYSETCGHCQDQIDLFQGKFDQLNNVINCSKDQDKCDVQYVPTWKYDGEEDVGLKNLSELKSILDS